MDLRDSAISSASDGMPSGWICSGKDRDRTLVKRFNVEEALANAVIARYTS